VRTLRSTFLSGAAFAIASAIAGRAWAQACCAGTGALTPGRLASYESALVGTQLHAATVTGSYDERSQYIGSPSGATEHDFEEDLFGAVRVLPRAQLALLVPLMETFRKEQGTSELGGGVGDANLSARYDYTLAGRSRIVPGIAALLGLTMPTGTPADGASKPLATDATGVGAWQSNVGLALEQAYGPWLLNATAILAWRAPRTVRGIDETLSPQLTTLLGAAFVFDTQAAVAVLASYTLEGEAHIGGIAAAGSARRVALLSLSGVYPLSEAWRVQASLFTNPPLSGLGRNQPATTGLTLTLLRSWS
jgi:hypothetical protein